MFGEIKQHTIQGQVIHIDFEHQEGRVEIISSKIINIFAGFENPKHQSKAIEGDKTEKTDFSVQIENDRIVIKTEDLIVEVFDEFKVDFYNNKYELLCADYRGTRTSINSLDAELQKIALLEGHSVTEAATSKKIEVLKALEGEEAFYGLGDKTGFLNKRGYEYEMWNSDIPDPQVDSFKSLYKSIPFFITLKKKHVFGIFFDNTYRTYFNMGKESNEYYYFASEEGNLDYYFIAGEAMADIVKGYTYLTGTTPLPQLWTLGYHQSRWSYMNKEEVLNLARNFRELDIPCDCIHLDIDYMEAYKVFTWKEERFGKADNLIRDLAKDGFKIVTIVDPGVKIEKGYSIYDEGIDGSYFAKDNQGKVYENAVWPGPAVFPDFSDSKVRSWWGDKHQFLLEKGVRGIWNDMNEPASFNGELPDDVQFSEEGNQANHLKIHNIYGHCMAKATFEGLQKYDNKRPYIITRACFSGSQKYTTAWTGDNHSIWAHLQMSIPQLCNLGMSGMYFVGTDVGGFGSDCTPELLSRWVQVGCFSPFFRNHSALNTQRQEPWAFNQETLEINRKYIKLRYRLLPYLYDLFWLSQNSGLPIMRPLVFEYQQDATVREINDQFMLGSNILVAPVVNQGQRVRAVYLPEGEWIDYWTKEVIHGGRYILKEAPLDLCPIYVKAGSIIPNFPELHYVGEREITELTLDIYQGAGEYHHFQDNGEDYDYKEGIYNEYCFSLEENDKLTIELLHNGYDKCYQSFKILWNGLEKTVPFQGKKVVVDL